MIASISSGRSRARIVVVGATGGGFTGRRRRVGDRQRRDHARFGVAGDAAVQLIGPHVEGAERQRGVLAGVEHRGLGAGLADDDVVLLAAVVGDEQRHVAGRGLEVAFDLELRERETERGRTTSGAVGTSGAPVVLVAQQPDQPDHDHGRDQSDQQPRHGDEDEPAATIVTVGRGGGRGIFDTGHA